MHIQKHVCNPGHFSVPVNVISSFWSSLRTWICHGLSCSVCTICRTLDLKSVEEEEEEEEQQLIGQDGASCQSSDSV